MTFAPPPSTIRPKMTMAQARTLSHLKRNGNNVIGYDASTGPFEDDRYVVFVTTRKEFHVREDGHILSPHGDLPARPSSGRRRSLREHPDGATGQEQ